MTPQQLREWGKGMYTTEAGTELLLRAFGGRFAQPGRPWVKTEELDSPWIDFDAIPDDIEGLSGGERRFLLLIASLGGGSPVVLSDALPGLDRTVMDLVLSAVAHAAGTHEQSEMLDTEDGISFQRREGLYPWPAPAPTVIDGGKP